MIDHFVLACADGDVGAERLSAEFGARLAPGGSHAGNATRNHLGGLGDAYLELLSPDTAQERWEKKAAAFPEEPTLTSWCVRSADLEGLGAKARELGFTVEGPTAWSREGAEGTLTWRLLFVRHQAVGGAAPFFIDWGKTTHPSTSAPAIGAFDSLSIWVPQPDALKSLLAFAGVAVDVNEGEAEMDLSLSSPRGVRRFSASGPLLARI